MDEDKHFFPRLSSRTGTKFRCSPQNMAQRGPHSVSALLFYGILRGKSPCSPLAFPLAPQTPMGITSAVMTKQRGRKQAPIE